MMCKCLRLCTDLPFPVFLLSFLQRLLLGDSWVPSKASWGLLGATLPPSAAPLNDRVPIWSILGVVLGPSWAVLRLSWGRLGACWAVVVSLSLSLSLFLSPTLIFQDSRLRMSPSLLREPPCSGVHVGQSSMTDLGQLPSDVAGA